MRLVIIGGVAAGMSAASQARRARPDAEILVLEKTQDVSYGACGLPYKLPPDTDMDDLLVISAQRFRDERNIDVRLGHEVLKIDPSRREILGRNAEGDFVLGYDKLIICTGARVWAPPIKGLDLLWGQGAYPLKTIDDGRTIKAAMAAHPPKRVVVIGAGYIGLEATENFREFFGLEVARTGLSSEEADAAGLDTATAEILGSTRAGYYPGGGKLSVWLIGERKTRKLIGCCMVGPEAAAHKIDTAAAAIHAGMTAEQIYDMDLAYAPPFGPSWSPLLIAASQLSKALD